MYHIPWNVTFLFRRAVPRWQIFEASGETYDNEHEQGTDTTLEKSKTESLRVEPLPIVADSGKDEAETPECNDNTGNSLNGEALGKNHGRIGAKNEAKVEDGGRPGISVTTKVEIGSKSKKCLFGNGSQVRYL